MFMIMILYTYKDVGLMNSSFTGNVLNTSTTSVYIRNNTDCLIYVAILKTAFLNKFIITSSTTNLYCL